MHHKKQFGLALRQILFSRVFLIFVLVFLLSAAAPLILEYFIRLYFLPASLSGWATLHMLDFIFYYTLYISAALAVFIPLSLSQLHMTFGDSLTTHKRSLSRNLLVFEIISLIFAACFIFAYILMAGILTPIGTATHIRTVWKPHVHPAYRPALVSLLNIFSFVSLFLLTSTLIRKKNIAIAVNLAIWAISVFLYFPFHEMTIFPSGIHKTAAMKKQVAILSFLKDFNPGSLAVSIADRAVYRQNMLRMTLRSLLFTAVVLALTFLIAHFKDVKTKHKAALK